MANRVKLPATMWTGRRYLLREKVLAIRIVEKLRQAKRNIPEGEVLEVISGPRPDAIHLVDVRWKGYEFKVFASDIQEAGNEVRK